MRSVVELTPKQLRSAAAIQEKIQKLQRELQELFGGAKTSKTEPSSTSSKKRTMSAAGRAKIRKAQKERWARFRAAKKANR